MKPQEIDTYKQVPYPNQRLSKEQRAVIEAIRESKGISLKATMKDGESIVFRPLETSKKFAHDIALAVQSAMMEELKNRHNNQ